MSGSIVRSFLSRLVHTFLNEEPPIIADQAFLAHFCTAGFQFRLVGLPLGTHLLEFLCCQPLRVGWRCGRALCWCWRWRSHHCDQKKCDDTNEPLADHELLQSWCCTSRLNTSRLEYLGRAHQRDPHAPR